VDVSVYQNSAVWDYDVQLINNESTNVKYEYWTCTTLAPGSVTGQTATPLNSEIVIPVEKYAAGWSPGSWIGSNNSQYDLTKIDHLSKWNDMGIAYALNLNKPYWGVINHTNEEGIFRLSENVETKGLKLWTWGKNNVNNNMFDFSNGGADNYIELWAGVSDRFFSDANFAANGRKNWKESYMATVGLTSIVEINASAAVNLTWNESTAMLGYELNTFQSDREFDLKIYLNNQNEQLISESLVTFKPLGQFDQLDLSSFDWLAGENEVKFELWENGNLIIEASKWIQKSTTLSLNQTNSDLKIQYLSQNTVKAVLPSQGQYRTLVYGLNGQKILQSDFYGQEMDIQLPRSGLYIVKIQGMNEIFTSKILL